MFELELHGPDDVNSALEQLALGESVLVVAGEQNRRPKSWLIHDAVELASVRGGRVHRPKWVTRGVLTRQCHMKSCVLIPSPPEDPGAGVREPRRPLPPDPTMQAAREVDE